MPDDGRVVVPGRVTVVGRVVVPGRVTVPLGRVVLLPGRVTEVPGRVVELFPGRVMVTPGRVVLPGRVTVPLGLVLLLVPGRVTVPLLGRAEALVFGRMLPGRTEPAFVFPPEGRLGRILPAVPPPLKLGRKPVIGWGRLPEP